MQARETVEAAPSGPLQSRADDRGQTVGHPVLCGRGTDDELVTLGQIVIYLRDHRSIPERAAFREVAGHKWQEWFDGWQDELDYFPSKEVVPCRVNLKGRFYGVDGGQAIPEPTVTILLVSDAWERHDIGAPETWGDFARGRARQIAFRKSEAIHAGFWPAGDYPGTPSACSVPGSRTLEEVMAKLPQRLKDPNREGSHFTDEFKLRAVKEVYEPFFARNKGAVIEAAELLGVGDRTLRRWIADYGKDGDGSSNASLKRAGPFDQLR